MHDQSASRTSGRTRRAKSAICLRSVRIAVLKSAGKFTRGEWVYLSAEKVWRVKLFVHAAQNLLRAGNFRNVRMAGRVRKFQPAVRLCAVALARSSPIPSTAFATILLIAHSSRLEAGPSSLSTTYLMDHLMSGTMDQKPRNELPAWIWGLAF